MNIEKSEDIKDTAFKLNEILNQSPTDYFYLKGWINCLTQKKEDHHKPPTDKTA